MYNHKEIEKKWQNYWEQNSTFKTDNSDTSKPKFYTLDMFPYPSGAGLHVGHPEWYTANDIVSRYKHATGHNVLHPMGWDAFGLPAENYAIKTGTHPRITTDQNIANFKRQIKALGFSYDWDREIDTTDPEYYKWTQWIFLKMFEKGLAYEQNLPINYCPSCKTGLANEEVTNNFTCERCDTKVEKKKIRQWVLAITKYAERLLNDVDKLDWPEGIKDMQRNWIGKSEGCEFEMKKSDDGSKSIRVYTTRVDTVFGMTYAVLAPDHPHVDDFIHSDQATVCAEYIDAANHKSDQDRTEDDKEKTGVFTGSYVVNPFNGQEVPLWIGDYVLGNYGTGAVMAVPAHDTRDFEFAKKYDLDIKQSIAPLFILDGPLKSRTDVETIQNRTATGIIEHNNKFLLLQEHESWDIGFPGWWVEWQETIEETVLREVTEETWYTSPYIISKVIDRVMCHGYRVTKKVNQNSSDTFYHIGLNSENTNSLSEKENSQHKTVWLEKDEVWKKLTWPQHKYVWEIFQNPSAYTKDGVLINSGNFNDLNSQEAREKLTAFAEENGFWNKTVNYKLRDWLFSRQRYWGEPIPVVHCEGCGIVGEKEENLPILLPDTDHFEPAGDGTSPLSLIDDFVNCECPSCGWPAKRETNTMPQWWGSCWYYLRFMDNKNSENIVDPEVEKYWGQVDSYVGWAEHAVLHLLYARFWHKFLFDIGVVSSDEPFQRLRNQGLILAHAYQRENGTLVANDEVEECDGKYIEIATWEELSRIVSKMSKSLKNVINPDDIVEQHGADALRLYEMYMADFKDSAPWDSTGITGVRRFIEKSERLFDDDAKVSSENDETTMKLLHKTIKKVSEDIENYKFNTAIAQMMILVNNGLPKDEALQAEWKHTFIRVLHPFTPHLAEELWEKIGQTESVFFASWPEYDKAMTVDNTIVIGVQVLGKLRGEIEISKDEDKDSVLEKAKNNENVAKFLEGKDLVKEIYVPGRIVNLVVK